MFVNTYAPEGMRYKIKENKNALACPEALECAARQGQILEAPVLLCDNQMRLHVDLGCMTGIIEREEAVLCRPGEVIKDIAVITRVGKQVCFRVIGFGEENGRRVAYLSRKAAQEECAERHLLCLRPGDVLPAKVTHLENYGAFVDIGCGISSLLSIDCISVSRITHPRERLACGMQIAVAIKSIDPVSKRIFVTMKELLGSWEENAAQFEAGQTVMGRVRSIESYGIFVELTPNLAGLAELRGSIGTPIRTAVGDLAAVYIKSILPERMKIKLVIIDSHAEPEFPEQPKYFINPEKTPHIDRWSYSPSCSPRSIETVF